MDVLVVGATGTLGRQVVRRALEEGHRVRCFVRSPKKAAFLKEWGAELIRGDLTQLESISPALEGIEAIIDAATARPTDSLSCYQVDWQGKVNLIQAAYDAGVDRYIFFSILNAEQHQDVPLMNIKYCTEQYLKQLGMRYTILPLTGFLQGLIGQYAIPILEGQTVWVTGEATPIAYLDTLDIARFAVRALAVPATEKGRFPISGEKPWSGLELIRLCERLSGREAKIARMPIETLRVVRKFARFFQWGWNLSDRLAFTEVLVSGEPLSAPMEETYSIFGLDPNSVTIVETYLEEYFSRIMKKLRELNFDQKKDKKKKIPF
jgi:uncharacterized protein YbjT (DUF2867 family)